MWWLIDRLDVVAEVDKLVEAMSFWFHWGCDGGDIDCKTEKTREWIKMKSYLNIIVNPQLSPQGLKYKRKML